MLGPALLGEAAEGEGEGNATQEHTIA